MTQETVGYVELEWICKRCGTKNRGTEKKCSSCGSPMSEQDKFEAPAQQELIKDEALLAKAKQGPDVHCPYCGARSPAGSEKCVQCGASLTDAKARQAGQVMGAFQAGPAADVPCPFCGELNPANAPKCKKCGGVLQKAAAAPAQPAAAGIPKAGLGIGAAVFGVLLCVCVIGFFILQGRTTDTVATVQSVAWERAISIEEQRPVEHSDWEDQIPAGAQKGSCQSKFRKTQAEPAPGAKQVCGTPYTVDQGSGVGKVVQDCEYQVYDNWCSYTAREWTVVDKAVAQGNDVNPEWPNLSLGSGQREGQRAEKYEVTFSANDKSKTYTYNIDTASDFAKFAVGTQWTLKINTFGAVVNAEPR